ncbi:MAG TPA: hypothetical protein VFT14_06115, partial [Solirubrobacterales bacterium]|nr:hypothetical protein [Solirubrobacterales bacterium]
MASTPPDTNATNNSETETTTVLSKGGQAKGKKKGRVSCATPTITGTAGDDVLVGTAAGDVIVSLEGN